MSGLEATNRISDLRMVRKGLRGAELVARMDYRQATRADFREIAEIAGGDGMLDWLLTTRIPVAG